jgi:Flp pilus assembly protein TadD
MDRLEEGKQTLMAANGRLSFIVAAEATFLSVIEQYPKDARAHYWLGVSVCYQGRASDAVTHFRQAVKLHDQSGGLLAQEYAQAHERLGEGLMMAGHFEEAELELGRAVKLQTTPEVGQRLNSASYMLDGLSRRKKSGSSRKLARWPVQLTECASLERVIHHATLGIVSEKPILKRDVPVSTLGSCFALNIAHALTRLGVTVHAFGMGELINSTFANRALLEWITGEQSPSYEPSVIDVLRAYFGDSPGEARRRLTESGVIIFTLGVAPGFFDRKSGLFHLTQPGSNTLHLLAEKEFRTTSVDENVENIEYIVSAIRKLSADIQVVFTVSPVPLYSTFEYSSAVIADCVSKSTLRVAIDAYLKRSPPGVHYWPAFEIVRWLGAYHGPMYGAEDGTSRHVSEQVVAAITKKFVQVYGTDDVIAGLENPT